MHFPKSKHNILDYCLILEIIGDLNKEWLTIAIPEYSK